MKLFASLAASLALVVALPTGAEARSSARKNKASTPSAQRTDGKTKAATRSDSKETTSAVEEISVTDSSSTISEEIRKADARPSGAASPAADKVLVVNVNGLMAERGSTVVLFGEETQSLKDYLDLLRKAREDQNIKTVVMRFAATDMGMATAQELRQAVEDLKKKGKRTVALVENDSQVVYLAASSCDEVVVPPSGDISVYGVKADMYYLKNLLEKVGVAADIVHMGQYKSYGETFTNDSPTTPARENMTEIVDDTFAQFVDQIAESRKLPREQVEAIINRGPMGAHEARESGFIDRVAYADDVVAELKKKGAEVVAAEDYHKGSSESSSVSDLSLFSLISMMGKEKAGDKGGDSKYPQVAVVYAVGPIELGSSDGMGFSSEEVIASEDFIETLEEVRADKKVKAVILRVNSPGGSAFASDLIWKKVEELKKEKPVVASMSEVAASGGYYISMGADKIIAQAGTLTGSIGVVGGKPNLAGLYAKLGINKETISRGDYAGLYSETSNFSVRERESIERMMRRTYDEFITKAAAGRNMPKERLDEVAQGKVWTGTRAKSVGLVDEIGGMGKAVEVVKKALGMKQEEKIALVAYPKEKGLMEILQKAMGTGSVTRAAIPAFSGLEGAGLQAIWSELPRGLRQALAGAGAVARMLQKEQVLAVMPAVPSIH